MTDREELEKEANDYADEHAFRVPYDGSNKFYDDVDFKASKEGYLAGAEFGYNKANEWHYPSKGELPKEDTAEKETLYLLWFGLDDSDYMTGIFSHGRFWCFDCGWFETNEVIAWQEIVPPKEENK